MHDIYYEQLLFNDLASSIIFMILIIVIIGIVNFLLFAIGIKKMASRLNIRNSWLAYVPFASIWVFGEVIKSKMPEPFNRNTGW